MQQRMHMPCLGWERCFSRPEAQHQEHLTPMSHCILQFPLWPRKTLWAVQGSREFPHSRESQAVTSSCRLSHAQWNILSSGCWKRSAQNCSGKQQHNPNIYLQCLTWTLSGSPVWRGDKHRVRKGFEPGGSSQSSTLNESRGWDCWSAPPHLPCALLLPRAPPRVTAVTPSHTRGHS